MDEELEDFLLFLLFRKSESLQRINYTALLDAFDEDYLMERSMHEDKVVFKGSDTETDYEQEKSKQRTEQSQEQIAHKSTQQEDKN